MATADGVKAKIAGLIAAANEATGKPDTDLTTAVSRLIESGGCGVDDIDDLLDGSIQTISNSRVTKLRPSALARCSTLVSASFPAVTRAGDYAFQMCTALTEVYLPELTSGGTALLEATNIATADFPKYAGSSSNRMLSQCKNLTSVNFPMLTKADANQFANCSALPEISLPKVTEVYSSAFASCSALQRVEFGTAVGLYRDGIFAGCTSLTCLILRGSSVATLSYTSAFKNTPIEGGTGYIYVPSSLIDSYKTATNWVTFSDQFRAIEDYPDIVGGTT